MNGIGAMIRKLWKREYGKPMERGTKCTITEIETSSYINAKKKVGNGNSAKMVVVRNVMLIYSVISISI